MEYGQLTVETLDDVTPRLREFTVDLIKRLRACEIDVETTTVYLLNSTDHPIEVPSSGDGVPIEMNFDATLPVWAPEPRARLQASFNHGRRYYFVERGKKASNAKFAMARVLKRFLTEIKIEERKRRLAVEKEEKAVQAAQRFKVMAEELGIPMAGDPPQIKKGNVQVSCQPQKSTEVRLSISIPHAQAVEIITKYMKE